MCLHVMSRIKQESTFPDDWKQCSDQGREMWTETYRGGLIMTILNPSGERLLACLEKPQVQEIRAFLDEHFGVMKPYVRPDPM